jgi:adenine deaminase
MGDESELQTTGSILDGDLMEELLDLPEAAGLAEVLAMPILDESASGERIIKLAESRKKTAEGHAPALTGARLNAYAGAGIRSEHESTTTEEALEKLRAGLRVLLREGSASTDLSAGIKMVTERHVDTRRISLVSDDIDALHLTDCGHLDHKVRMAIREGVDPIKAIQMVTINPAESLKIDDETGSVSPGKYADIVFLSSLEDCRVEKVLSRGRLVVDEGRLTETFPSPRYSDLLTNTIRLNRRIQPEDLLLRADREEGRADVHVIAISGDTLLTRKSRASLRVEQGFIRADASNDILHLACVERYGKGGGVGKSFVSGVGLKRGAIALSVGHDHHNITAVGVNAADMAAAVDAVSRCGGGVFYADGDAISGVALPICGLLSTESGQTVAEGLRRLIETLRGNGCVLPSPNVTLSFITLIFIPELAITDKGLFDVTDFRLIDPIISVSV